MSKSEKMLITEYLQTTEALLKSELLSQVEREAVLVKLKQRWSFLNMRSTFREWLKTHKLRSLDAADLFEVKRFVAEIFPEQPAEIVPDEKSGSLDISVLTLEGKLEGQLSVEPEVAKEEKAQMLAFLVCLSGDPGLAWVFGRPETMTDAEARIALSAVEEEFWQTKKGLKFKKMNKSNFATFVEHVPAASLRARGLKRHYRLPSAIVTKDVSGATFQTQPVDGHPAEVPIKV